MQEQELFQSYEIRNWEFNPRIYKILAFSAVFNVLAILIIGQTNLLTTKGCDSPLVGGVCQVIDTLYVGGTVLATNTETGEAPYDPTTLSPDDEIVWVNRDEEFKYPVGYFNASNPQAVPTEITGDGTFPEIPGIPNPTTNPTITGSGGTNDLLSQPQQLPQPNDNAVIGRLPTSPLGTDNPTFTTPRVKNQRPTWRKNQKNPTLTNESPTSLDPLGNNDKTANNQNANKNVQPTPTPDPDDVAKEDDYGIFKNKKPLKDFATRAKAEVKNVKLDAPFSVTIMADLDYGKDGKTVVLKNPKPVKTNQPMPNDEQMAKLAQDAILAIGDSGWLGYLKTIGIKKVVFTLSQDNDFITANILGEQKDENSAKTSASGLNGIISLGKAKTDGDEKVLLDNATITSEGKSVILKVTIPKQIALEMINRKLKEAEEVKTEPKQNGSTAQIKESNPTTAK